MSSTQIPEIVMPGQCIIVVHKIDSVTNQVNNYFSGEGTLVTYLKKSNDNSTNDGKKFVQIPIITATVYGKTFFSEIEVETSNENKNKKSVIVSVIPIKKSFSSILEIKSTCDEIKKKCKIEKKLRRVPKENDIVYAKIKKVCQKQVHCDILVLEGDNEFVNILEKNSNNQFVHSLLDQSGGVQITNSHDVIVSHKSNFSNSYSTDFDENFKGIIRQHDIRFYDSNNKLVSSDCFKPGDIVRAQILSLGDSFNYYLSTNKDNLGVIFAISSDESNMGSLLFPVDWNTMIDKNGNIQQRKCAKPFLT